MQDNGIKWFLLALLLAILASSLYVARRDLRGRYEKYEDNKRAVEEAEMKMQELERQLEQSRRKVDNLVRQGEKVYHIEDNPDSSIASPEVIETDPEKESGEDGD